MKIWNGYEVERAIGHRAYTDSEVVGWVGMKGFGKTEGMKHFLRVREPRVLALDAFDDFEGLKLVADLDTALDDMQRFTRSCRRRVQPPFDADTYGYGAMAMQAILESLRNAVLALDELLMWVRPQTLDAFRKVIVQGRRLGIRTHYAAQLISLIPTEVKSQTTDLVIFHLSRPSDLEYLAKWTSKRIATTAKELEIGQCLHVRL